VQLVSEELWIAVGDVQPARDHASKRIDIRMVDTLIERFVLIDLSPLI
jgi:hypothetical protein